MPIFKKNKQADRAEKLYAAEQFAEICQAMAEHLSAAAAAGYQEAD